jgi:hypothetical protein
MAPATDHIQATPPRPPLERREARPGGPDVAATDTLAVATPPEGRKPLAPVQIWPAAARGHGDATATPSGMKKGRWEVQALDLASGGLDPPSRPRSLAGDEPGGRS